MKDYIAAMVSTKEKDIDDKLYDIIFVMKSKIEHFEKSRMSRSSKISEIDSMKQFLESQMNELISLDAERKVWAEVQSMVK